MEHIKKYLLKDLAVRLAAEFVGDGECIVESIGSLATAQVGQISFLQDAKHLADLATTQASVVIMRSQDWDALRPSGNFILVPNPYLAYAKVSALFNDAPFLAPGIHSTAVVGEDCVLGDQVSIGPHVVIGRGVELGDEVKIEAGCVVGDKVVLGAGTHLHSNVTLYHRVRVGRFTTIHSGAVIGADGFGNANDRGVWHKIYQLGRVVIGDGVEIGANTTVDRGAIEDTVIEDGVKIDNLVQIGHNVRIGAHTAIAGCVGIAGSTKIGKYCMIGGKVGINGHLEIADRVVVAGMSSIGKSIIEPGGVYASAMPAMPHRSWWRIVAQLAQLDKLVRRLSKLEKRQYERD